VVFLKFFPNCLEFLIKILHTYYTFTFRLNYIAAEKFRYVYNTLELVNEFVVFK